MPVVSGHYAADDLPLSHRDEQKPVANRKLFFKYELRRVVRTGISENLLPQFNQLIPVAQHVKLLDDFVRNLSLLPKFY
jgi:hypothetical protein